MKEIIHELEEDLMVIALNMTHELEMTETKQRIFLRRVRKYVQDFNIFWRRDECLCQLWNVGIERERKSPGYTVRVEMASARLQRVWASLEHIRSASRNAGG